MSIAGATALAAVTSACGVSVNTANGSSSSSFSTSQQLLVNAVDKLTQADSLKMDLYFDISPGALSQIESSMQSSSSSAQIGVAEKLIQGHIIITESSNGPLTSVTPTNPASYDISFVAGGSTLIDIREVDQNLYLRADVNTIASWAGQSLSNFEQQLATAPSQVQQWATAAINGDWLELSQSQLQAIDGLLQQRAGAAGGSSLTPAQARQLANEFTSVVQGVFVKDVSVTDKGSTAKGEQLALTADAHNSLTDLANGLLPLLEKVDPTMTRVSPSEIQQGLTQVPHKKVTADAYVSNGSLSELSMDVLQFAPASTPGIAGQNFTIVSDFTPNIGAVTAPSGATQLDIASLLSQLGSSVKL